MNPVKVSGPTEVQLLLCNQGACTASRWTTLVFFPPASRFCAVRTDSTASLMWVVLQLGHSLERLRMFFGPLTETNST